MWITWRQSVFGCGSITVVTLHHGTSGNLTGTLELVVMVVYVVRVRVKMTYNRFKKEVWLKLL